MLPNAVVGEFGSKCWGTVPESDAEGAVQPFVDALDRVGTQTNSARGGQPMARRTHSTVRHAVSAPMLHRSRGADRRGSNGVYRKEHGDPPARQGRRRVLRRGANNPTAKKEQPADRDQKVLVGDSARRRAGLSWREDEPAGRSRPGRDVRRLPRDLRRPSVATRSRAGLLTADGEVRRDVSGILACCPAGLGNREPPGPIRGRAVRQRGPAAAPTARLGPAGTMRS